MPEPSDGYSPGGQGESEAHDGNVEGQGHGDGGEAAEKLEDEEDPQEEAEEEEEEEEEDDDDHAGHSRADGVCALRSTRRLPS